MSIKVKITNALMKYLREQHNISIDSSKDKKNLRTCKKFFFVIYI